MAERHPDPSNSEGRAAVPIELAKLQCSFCGKPRDQVENMICGPTPAVAICNECVDLATELIAEEREASGDNS